LKKRNGSAKPREALLKNAIVSVVRRAVFARNLIVAFLQINEFMKKTKTPRAKKKTDRIEDLVKKHLANIGKAEETFRKASALLEKYKTKYPELEQYVKNVSPDDRSIQMDDDVKDPRHAHHSFKIAIAGVAVTYQMTHSEEKEPTKVDEVDWIMRLEEVLAKAIAQITLARQSEPASK
jgi:hypothetical protein